VYPDNSARSLPEYINLPPASARERSNRLLETYPGC
jgi:hypothetical protein